MRLGPKELLVVVMAGLFLFSRFGIIRPGGEADDPVFDRQFFIWLGIILGVFALVWGLLTLLF